MIDIWQYSIDLQLCLQGHRRTELVETDELPCWFPNYDEAVRAGFKKAWQDRDYATIIGVAEKIPNKVLEEDPKLLMWYDQAVTRMGGE